MPVTAKGQLYARLVYAGSRVWESEVPEKYRQDCYDSYVDYGYKPDIEPPTA